MILLCWSSLLAIASLAECATINQVISSSFTPVKPPAIPLAVKSPYLSAWIRAGPDGGNGGYLAGTWARHWTGKYLGWAGMIKVDGKTFTWMGDPGKHPLADQQSFEYTSTKSIFRFKVDNRVDLTVTFLSPVTPHDLTRQSLVGSYMDVTARSADGRPHDIKIYTDISAEWASGEPNAEVEWSHNTINGVQAHKVWRKHQFEFDESDKPDGNGMANWGSIWYAVENQEGLSFKAGSDSETRSLFNKEGKLDNKSDKDFRRINDRWPVFAYAVDLGRDVSSTPKTTRFSIGLAQRNAVQFLNKGGNRKLASMWTNFFKTEDEMLAYFHRDYPAMDEASTTLDRKVRSDSLAAGGENLAMITELTVRQTFGATQLVNDGDSQYLFLKEISSNGNTQTVDVIFPMHPILLYTNPELLKFMLEPLFEQQENGHWPHKFAIHDLGYHYPNATGHANGESEEMPVEECGNMIIMVAAYAKWSKDYSFVKKHWNILTQWAQFLIADSLIPDNQLSTDDFAGKLQNQTNLALKGIIGIKAMALLSDYIGDAREKDHYNQFASKYIRLWQDYGTTKGKSQPHTTLHYGNEESHGLLYNLWADVELDLKLVPDSVYKMQSDFYPTQRKKYGVPLDTRHTWTKTDWLIYAAAASSKSTSDLLIGDIAKWLRETTTSLPFTDLYETEQPGFPGVEFKARPVMGAAFAPLIARRY